MKFEFDEFLLDYGLKNIELQEVTRQSLDTKASIFIGLGGIILSIEFDINNDLAKGSLIVGLLFCALALMVRRYKDKRIYDLISVYGDSFKENNQKKQRAIIGEFADIRDSYFQNNKLKAQFLMVGIILILIGLFLVVTHVVL